MASHKRQREENDDLWAIRALPTEAMMSVSDEPMKRSMGSFVSKMLDKHAWDGACARQQLQLRIIALQFACIPLEQTCSLSQRSHVKFRHRAFEGLRVDTILI
jgi:hypothetical protein